MARKGRAGVALATAAIGSFAAGTVATLLIVLFAPPLARVALTFGSAEFFSLVVLGLPHISGDALRPCRGARGTGRATLVKTSVTV